ncbi:hypothetical protein HA402_012882 [Bradysia odoriphaga]|nr:hypothetical protein HA402_012882 [Bradysia odoriphaga]
MKFTFALLIYLIIVTVFVNSNPIANGRSKRFVRNIVHPQLLTIARRAASRKAVIVVNELFARVREYERIKNLQNNRNMERFIVSSPKTYIDYAAFTSKPYFDEIKKEAQQDFDDLKAGQYAAFIYTTEANRLRGL